MATVVISPFSATQYLDRGGNLWVYLQYALGLQAIGCDVHWLERLEPPGSGNGEGLQLPTEQQARLLAGALEAVGLQNPPILYTTEEGASGFDPTYVGTGPNHAEAVLRRAELLLNFHHTIHPELLARFERTALVDIDPGLLQYWIASGQLDVPDHDVNFTIGETVGTPDAGFSDCGRAWVHVRPPVFLPAWPFVPGPAVAPFTTVSSWYGSDEYVLEGDGFWDNNKRVSWLQFIELPRLTDQALELATYFGDKDAHERTLLETRGWRVRHAGEVAGTHEGYRAYIQSSRAELSCAKPSCMRFQNAWVSDRTACYLASGRPAIVQDTGPSRYLPSGCGVHRFGTVEAAADAIAQVNSAYDENSRAAREIAETHFDATKVANRILDAALPSRKAYAGLVERS